MDLPTALVVDDEPHIRRVVASALTVDGWNVDEAGDGQEALARLAVSKADVMLLDLRMPRLDGGELLRRLSTMSDPPVVVVTSAYAESEDIVEVLRLGAVDFLPKPFDPTTLRRVMRDALEKEPPHPPRTAAEFCAAMKRHARRRSFDAAERDVRAAIALDPKYADAFYYLGVLLELRGASADARSAYEKAVSLKPRLFAARKRIEKIDAAGASANSAHP